MTLLRVLERSLPCAAAGVQARCVGPADRGFLSALYASTREHELAATGWPAPQWHAFVAQQFECQDRYYRSHYPAAEHLLLHAAGEPIGRVVWHQAAASATLIDMSLVPAWRGRGVGTAVLRLLTGLADSAGCAVGLHVEPSNPARHLYARHGFEAVGDDGIYLKMRRPAARTLQDQPC
jgi:GNAT superfamily N-acetyltransferase